MFTVRTAPLILFCLITPILKIQQLHQGKVCMGIWSRCGRTTGLTVDQPSGVQLCGLRPHSHGCTLVPLKVIALKREGYGSSYQSPYPHDFSPSYTDTP